MKILVISDCVPYPLISGDRIRLYNLLLRIARNNKIWLVSFIGEEEICVDINPLKKICQRVETVNLNHKHKISYIPKMIKFGWKGLPLELAYYYSKELIQKIRDLFLEEEFDVVDIQHSHMAMYFEAIPRASELNSILTFHNVEFDRMFRISQIEKTFSRKFRKWLLSRMMKQWEPKYAEKFTHCITMSDVDKRLLLGENPLLKVNIIPNGIDVDLFSPLPTPINFNQLLFIGSMDYEPCIDAALYFINEILPKIRDNLEKIELWVVGKNPPSKLKKLDNNGIHITGRVLDVLPFYQKTAVCVVPLRAGGGTRLKILEAMALGRPVVSSSIGCEGLNIINEENILIGDSPDQFAKQTIRLLNNRSLYNYLAQNARKLVCEQYDWEAISNKLMEIFHDI